MNLHGTNKRKNILINFIAKQTDSSFKFSSVEWKKTWKLKKNEWNRIDCRLIKTIRTY